MLYNISVSINLLKWIFLIHYFYFQDWENESTPLAPKGKGPPKFLKPEDKHSTNEGMKYHVIKHHSGAICFSVNLRIVGNR